jgi:hypothetical protein
MPQPEEKTPHEQVVSAEEGGPVATEPKVRFARNQGRVVFLSLIDARVDTSRSLSMAQGGDNLPPMHQTVVLYAR